LSNGLASAHADGLTKHLLHLNPLAMLFKSTTIVISAVFALLHNPKGQLQAIFIAAVVAGLIVWKLGTSQNNHSTPPATSAEVPAADQKMAGMKWSYDEIAHKLIVENTDLVYAEIGVGFSQGIGRALQKVTRQNGKGVVVNL
jgi:hypothetical protein